jgi:site-specific recombinase XerD
MTVNFRLRKSKTAGTIPVPVMVVLVHQGLRRELSTGEKIIPRFWGGNRAKASLKESEVVNTHLDNIEKSVLQVWRENTGVDPERLMGLAVLAVKGDNQPLLQKKTLVEIVQQFIAQYSTEKEIGTVKRYKSLLSKLEQFNPSLLPEQLDFNFYDAFKRFLYGGHNPLYSGFDLVFSAADNCYHLHPCDPERGVVSPVGLFDDVVFKYFVNLKTVCKWAEKRGNQVHQSFKDWEIIKRDYDPIYLTEEELNRLENVTLPKHLDVARDYLLLECHTGQRISDLRRFSKSDINGDVWTFKQKKGGRLNTKTVSLPLVGFCAPALLILQKYNYELPKLSEQKINEHIKLVCKLAGITDATTTTRYQGSKKVQISGFKWEFCSTHIGRKTFITLCLQNPSFTAKTVMDITGIRSFKTLSHYNGKSEIGNIRKALESMAGKTQLMKVV